MQNPPDKVQLKFRHTEEDYLAAARLFFWHTREPVLRLVICSVLLSIALLLLTMLLNLSLPLWILPALTFLVGMALYHGYLIDLPRRVFRGDPKFRDEYNLTVTDAGIELKTENISSSIAWSFYTAVVENDSFYLLVYGKNIASFSIFPKRAFRDTEQETTFRELVRRKIDPNLKLGRVESETKEYVPPRLGPPDWR